MQSDENRGRDNEMLNMKSTFFFNERLVQAMNNMLKVPFTIVSAQIGAGKTTAIRAALMNQPSQTILWHTFYKKNTHSFWQDFCEKIETLDESLGNLLWELGEDIPTEESAFRIVSQVLSSLTRSLKITIVIDNYTETERMLHLLNYLTWQSIDNLHIIILSRKNVPIDFELGLGGDIFYIDNSTFMLEEEDIVKYYQKAEIPISEEEVERIHRISGGWLPLLQAIGEQLIHSAGNSKMTDLTGCMQTMTEYMDQYLLSEVPASIRRFLFIFGYVDGFPSEFVSTYLDCYEPDSSGTFPEETRAEDVLSYLTQNNFFLDYDAEQKIYCFQAVFQLALRKEYEKLPLAEQEQLAETWIRAESACPGIWDVNRGYDGRVLHFALNAFHEEKEDSNYLLYLAFYFLIREDEEGYQEAMSKAGQLLEAQESRIVPPDYLLLKSRLGRDGREDALLEYVTACAKAGGLEQRGHYSMAWGNLMLIENFTDAKKMDALILKLEETLSACRGSFADLYKGWLSLLKGEQCMLRYDLDQAKICLYASYRYLPEGEDPALDLVRSYLDISILFYGGEMEEAEDRLHAVKEMQLHLHRDGFLTALDLGWRWRAGKDSVGEESERFSLQNETVSGCDTLRELITAEDLILNNQYLPFLGYFQHGDNGFSYNFYFRIYMLLYCAIACKKTQWPEESMNYFHTAVREAQGGNVYLPFLTLGYYLTSFLEESAETDNADFIRTLKEKIEIYHATKNEKAKIGLWRIESSETLTDRERQICYCVHDGLSNKEIGAKLLISENTVKSALKSVFRKLEITSRDML